MNFPGQLYRPLNFLGEFTRSSFISRIVPLTFIPLNTNICAVANTITQYPVYAKAPGSKAIRLRFNKKVKLVEILLPSQTIKFFPQHTLAI